MVLSYLLDFIIHNQNYLIGIGLPLLIFAIQLWLWKKDHKTCSITLIENRNVILDPSISNRVDGLSIVYKDKPINGMFLYYQITITNSGANDITNAEVHNPLTITLPSNIQIRSCKVFDKSEFMDISTRVDKNEIIIEWDLFKRDEYIRLDIIGDYSPSKEYSYERQSLLSRITYNKSRIPDLQVQKTNIRRYEIFLRNLKTTVFFCLIGMFLYSFINQRVIVKEYSYSSNDKVLSGQLTFGKDSVYVNNNHAIEYPIEVFGVKEKEIKSHNTIPKGNILILMNVWGFVLLEQLRMRRKRKRYGLVSDKPWNQFDIEDC